MLLVGEAFGKPDKPLRSIFYLGIDLGFTRDPTALAVIEEKTRLTGEWDGVYHRQRTETVLLLRQTRRLPLRMPYTELPALLDRHLDHLARHVPDAPIRLAVDATGVGLPVVERLREHFCRHSVTAYVITSGESAGTLPHARTVPRLALLHNLRGLLECRLLRCPQALTGLEDLKKEIYGLEERRRNKPDDQAFALALAAWEARPQPQIGLRQSIKPMPF